MDEVPTKRKAIGKRTRFEVFKRDFFKCQYCGAHPPSVILNVDHINPVSMGGANHIDNYITACESCNSGKSNILLSSVPQSLKDKAAETVERESQIAGYRRVMDKRRARIERDADRVCDVYERFYEGYTINESGMVSVRKFLEFLDVDVVCDAMEQAWTRRTVKRNQEFKYFCGICWRLIEGQRNAS